MKAAGFDEILPELWKTRQFGGILLPQCNAVYNQNPIGGAGGIMVTVIKKEKKRCPWCNGYRRRKWTRRHEFKSWTRLIAFHIALIPNYSPF